VNLIQEIARAHAEVERGSPGARERLARLQDEYRTSGAMISRIGGECRVVDRPSAAVSNRPRSISRDVLDYGHPSEAVELRRHSSEPTRFEVGFSSSARHMLEEEILRVRRDHGDVETGGWLFAVQRPRSWSTSLTVVVATDGGNSRVSRTSVEFGSDPYEIRERFPDEWHRFFWVGDWHVHQVRGSTVPSDRDVRAWAGAMDRTGISRYIGVIACPSAESGWAYGGQLSAWTVRRAGFPSKPICEPARLE
jgi:hypothetical protein